MGRPKSVLQYAGICLGIFGIVICVTALVVLWVASTSFERAAGNLFVKLDNALVGVRNRVVQVQERVATAKSNTGELGDALQDWAQQTAAQRLALMLQAAEKSERLAAVLQRADDSLEFAELSVGFAQDALSLIDSTGAPNDTLIYRLQEEIASLRTRLAEAIEFAGEIHGRLADPGIESSPKDRFDRALSLALRMAAVLGTLEPRLQSVAERISAAERQLQTHQVAVRRWILLVTIGHSLLILLMAAGQLALCRLAWAGQGVLFSARP